MIWITMLFACSMEHADTASYEQIKTTWECRDIVSGTEVNITVQTEELLSVAVLSNHLGTEEQFPLLETVGGYESHINTSFACIEIVNVEVIP